MAEEEKVKLLEKQSPEKVQSKGRAGYLILGLVGVIASIMFISFFGIIGILPLVACAGFAINEARKLVRDYREKVALSKSTLSDIKQITNDKEEKITKEKATPEEIINNIKNELKQDVVKLSQDGRDKLLLNGRINKIEAKLQNNDLKNMLNEINKLGELGKPLMKILSNEKISDKSKLSNLKIAIKDIKREVAKEIAQFIPLYEIISAKKNDMIKQLDQVESERYDINKLKLELRNEISSDFGTLESVKIVVEANKYINEIEQRLDKENLTSEDHKYITEKKQALKGLGLFGGEILDKEYTQRKDFMNEISAPLAQAVADISESLDNNMKPTPKPENKPSIFTTIRPGTFPKKASGKEQGQSEVLDNNMKPTPEPKKKFSIFSTIVPGTFPKKASGKGQGQERQ